MRIAITGSSGFIGTRLAMEVSELGMSVTKISRSQGIDLNKIDDLRSLEKCDVIIHLAALNNVSESFGNPSNYLSVNYNLTLNALELARQWSAKFIFVSSYIYGDPAYLPVDEKHPICPHNPYAESKYLSEELCRSYYRQFNLNVIILRPFNVYGPGQPKNLIISEILDKVFSSESVIHLRDDRPRRDYIHVDDVVRCLIASIYFKSESFEIFNLGTGHSTSIMELVKIIQRFSHNKFQVVFANEHRRAEVLETVANNVKIRDKFGISTFKSLEKGICELFLNYKTVN
jgi:nucleoside-diphosphate-sugar epimerase